MISADYAKYREECRKGRFKSCLRAEGIGENDPIDLEAMLFDVAIYDTLEKRFINPFKERYDAAQNRFVPKA